ncbi:IS110 family transposase [Ramlibacter sp. USB13]|uniref:IS110 family transposase n=1 Tax=Ramlibacter cellulosilyticus TaxID=2764187 RepID=A0A923MQN1_9BURK|nr:IS110 family transposase [Ramlibacter cellulosilyticus]MBC5783106.1 IS110 family transposase [Ramlibacter cellulosilyticus]
MTKRFAGLDWASRIHAVCVIDAHGKVVARLKVTHDAAGLAELCRWLRSMKVDAVAIERPSGLVVDTLLEAGFTVVPIHPNVVKATRPRYRSHGGKSDDGDAYLLADLLRTDGHRFKALLTECDQIRALRAMVRGRDDLVATRVQLANQLRELLQSFWPGAAEVFCEIDSPIALAFIESYPTPASAARLGARRMASFCSKHAYSGRRSPEELLQRLRQAASGGAAELEAQAKGALALALVRVLQPLLEQLRLLSKSIEQAVESSDDGRIIMSFPRAGRVCAAQILSELGSVRERFADLEQLEGEAGVTPVTRESGKSKVVVFRWACNHRLRAALTCLASNSRHENSWAAATYAKARARGCQHAHAIRILARAWLRVIWRAWQDRRPYDPQRHTAAKLYIATGG